MTTLKPYVDMLDKHVIGLMDEVRRSKKGMGEHSVFSVSGECDI
jgi:hypothetical protein